jgi:hypothetical protein
LDADAKRVRKWVTGKISAEADLRPGRVAGMVAA